jgi:hypothetical protein
MAKDRNENADAPVENVETPVDASAAPAAPAEAASAPDERFVMIKHDKTGEQVKRKDFILECWQQRKMGRGDIAKLLTQLQGKKVPYQIVFAATKKIPGGPDKVAEAPATGEAAPAENTTIGG